MYLIKLLLSAELSMKSETTEEGFFCSDTDMPQDCLSVIQFTLLSGKTTSKLVKIAIDNEKDAEDDISEITTKDQALKSTKEKIPKVLTDRDMKVNRDRNAT